jgi:hypothetical protein
MERIIAGSSNLLKNCRRTSCKWRKALDVLVIHFYPDVTAEADFVQVHRVFTIKTTTIPSQWSKKLNGGWDNTLTKEYIFGRCNEWLQRISVPIME